MPSKIDPKRLETFRVVAGAGKITAASQQLHLSQPAVTAQLRQLEEQVGKPLFVRGARGVALTDAGRELLDYAQRLHRLLEDAETDGWTRDQINKGKRRLGARIESERARERAGAATWALVDHATMTQRDPAGEGESPY